MKNFILAVGTCVHNLHRALHLQSNFKKYNFDNYYFYHGEGISPNNRFIKLNISDCYSELTKKTYEMLKHFYKNYEFDYLIKIDDDTFIDISTLRELNVEGFDYIGSTSTLQNHLNNFEFYKEYLLSKSLKKDIDFNYKEHLTDFTYVLGNFCILSKNIIRKILEFYDKNELCKKIPQEDISVGYACSNINANLLDLSENVPYYHIAKNISYHPVPFILQSLFFSLPSKADRIKVCKRFIQLNKYFKK